MKQKAMGMVRNRNPEQDCRRSAEKALRSLELK